MERLMIDNKPQLFLKAIQNIPANQELRYDYNFTDAEWWHNRQVRRDICHTLIYYIKCFRIMFPNYFELLQKTFYVVLISLNT